MWVITFKKNILIITNLIMFLKISTEEADIYNTRLGNLNNILYNANIY